MESIRYSMNYENCSLRYQHTSPKPLEDEQIPTPSTVGNGKLNSQGYGKQKYYGNGKQKYHHDGK